MRSKLSNLTKQSDNNKKIKIILIKDTKFNERYLFSINDLQGVKVLLRFRLNYSELNKHKIRHNVEDCLSRICGCGLEIVSTQYFFLNCHSYHAERSELLNRLYEMDLAIKEPNKVFVINFNFLGSDKYGH